jgi:hypothetical protein
MDFVDVPTYSDLFGSPNESYSELVRDIPSSSIVTIALVLNAELGSSEGMPTIQMKLLTAMTVAMPDHERQILQRNLAILARQAAAQGVTPLIFSKPHLVEWMAMEFSAYRDFESLDITKDQEYRALKAYLLVVEEFRRKRQGKPLTSPIIVL